MSKNIITTGAALLALAVPLAASAAFPPMPNPAGPLNILWLAQAVLNFIWIIFVAFAVIMFIIAGMKFFLAQGDPAEAKKAQFFVIYGVVGIFVAIIGFSIVWTVGAFFS